MISRTLAIVVLLLLALAPQAAVAQPTTLEFEHITSLEGLSQDIVSSIHRDRFGFLWIGTEDGLNRYDGYSLKVYKHVAGDSGTPASSWITGLCDYGQEDILVTTTGGLSIYHRATDSFRQAEGPLSEHADRSFHCPVRDSSGYYWFIIASHWLARCSPDLRHMRSFDIHAISDSLDFHCLVADSRGRVVAGTNSYLMIFDSSVTAPKMIRIEDRTAGGPPKVGVTAILEAGPGDFWVGAHSGLYRLKESDGALTSISLDRTGQPASTMRDLIFDLEYDHDGRIWCAGFGGLYCYDPRTGSSTSYRNLEAGASEAGAPRIYALYVDPAEVLWVGSWRGGLWKTSLHHAQFGLLRHTARTPFSEGGSNITAIYEDPQGRLWFGDARHGVTIADLSSNHFEYMTTASGKRPALSGVTISAIAGDSLGNVWIASEKNRVDWYNLRTGVMRTLRLPVRPGEKVSVLSLRSDGKGGLWIGTEAAGVYRYDLGRGEYAAAGGEGRGPDASPVKSAWTIFLDRASNVWIGGWTFNTNLHRIDGKTGHLTSYAQPSLQSARSLAEDDDGTIWIGTWGGGLSRLDPASGAVRTFVDHDGLASNYVKGLLRDDRGRLWLSTERGLSVFTPSTGQFQNYDVSDGLQGNFFYSGSCLRSRGGKFYFGGSQGVNGFFPDSIRTVDYVAPVILTGFFVLGELRRFDRDLGHVSEVEVSFLDNVLGFEYVGLDLRASSRNRYAYMMEGFNADWIDAGTRRFASYTHLDPGEYVFKVKGTNSDGIWNPVPAALRVVIVPVYWQTWWFRALLGACGVAFLWAVYQYRVRRLLELERTRSAIATDLHDDIGTGLTNIALFSDLAKRDLASGSGGLMHRLEKISLTSRELLDSMNDIVWSIKPENDALEQTILRMEDYAVEILEENGIDLHVQIPDRLRTLALPMSVRRNLFLVFKEAIGNVLKHAGATTVDVTIAAGESIRHDRGLLLTIRDNGKGFRVGEERFGNGLQNMDTRAHALQGTVRVSSAPGEGTTIEIWFPLNSPI